MTVTLNKLLKSFQRLNKSFKKRSSNEIKI